MAARLEPGLFDHCAGRDRPLQMLDGGRSRLAYPQRDPRPRIACARDRQPLGERDGFAVDLEEGALVRVIKPDDELRTIGAAVGLERLCTGQPHAEDSARQHGARQDNGLVPVHDRPL
ncbi:bll4166 [Bradyrhizobium diazoefficiens USDA 110]|uniref:Bll4166 protein n=1 Tax=Bradyrhizobium diazoefficiens (strain JCM 10833 / BCRC 13528 / IAM 13628 / NBRC 14792 / USDA 110) TaxID=224911 RepID=Q89MM6_BRADU|nr:bll4166 [Bradyrhizobium diazoefficiens USDA 110]